MSALSEAKSVLVIGAHAADFVWRAAGALAVASSRGAKSKVVALSYGERGESGELWKVEGQTIENVKRIRHEQGEQAAAAVGAEFIALDLGDYPLEVGRESLEQLGQIVRDMEPDVLITHTLLDPVNPDHPVACHAASAARQLAAGAGVASAFKVIKPPALYYFEPHQPELSGFIPNTFLDITDVYPMKQQAMEAMASQAYLVEYYSELATRRANHARRASGNKSIRYAEAYQRIDPAVVAQL